LQDPHDGAQRNNRRYDFLDEFRVRLGEVIEEVLYFLAPDHLVSMRFNDLTDMGGNDRGAVNNCVPGHLGPLFLILCDP